MASDEQQPAPAPLKRTSSVSAASESSQTAREYITSQLSLEAEAKLALPYQFDTCTNPLGPLRQTVYACLTCSPPPASVHQQYTPAGVCYSCSISCHGEHNLVELFTKRNFVCDCGTTRLENAGTPCSLRVNATTGRKGDVTGEEAEVKNRYNQNFKGNFCGCGEEYDPEVEKGTMFQCLGLGNVEDGGCGEDWWHPECLMGRKRAKKEEVKKEEVKKEEAKKEEMTVNVKVGEGQLETVVEEVGDGAEVAATNGVNGTSEEHGELDEAPLPAGFPEEDDFDQLICYKCVNANPWIKQYAGTPGFLPAVSVGGPAPTNNGHTTNGAVVSPTEVAADGKKRKADDDPEIAQDSLKKVKSESEIPASEGLTRTTTEFNAQTPKHTSLPPAPTGPITLFLREDFRDHLCRCPECFPRLAKHRQLLEEEEIYEPPISEDGDEAEGVRSVGSGSLYDRGEAALSSIDRVRAIEGAMAYNHLKDKLKPFLKQYADSGEAVGAEHINAFFAKLRGDEQAIREANEGAARG